MQTSKVTLKGCHWGHMIQATIGAMVSHAVFLSGGMDDDSICESGIISFPDSKTMSGQASQGLYEITLREEFTKMNELAGSLTLQEFKPVYLTRALWTAWKGRGFGSTTLWLAHK
jgi:hypothetical protein